MLAQCSGKQSRLILRFQLGTLIGQGVRQQGQAGTEALFEQAVRIRLGSRWCESDRGGCGQNAQTGLQGLLPAGCGGLNSLRRGVPGRALEHALQFFMPPVNLAFGYLGFLNLFQCRAQSLYQVQSFDESLPRGRRCPQQTVVER